MISVIAGVAAAGLFAFCGGMVTSAGYFAVINSIGMINRAASVTRTRDKVLFYEDSIVVGAVAGTFLSMYDGLFAAGKYIGVLLVIVYGLIAGMFIGLFVVCLAENVKAIPVLADRTGMAQGLGLAVLCIALGKAAGHILYYVVLYD